MSRTQGTKSRQHHRIETGLFHVAAYYVISNDPCWKRVSPIVNKNCKSWINTGIWYQNQTLWTHYVLLIMTKWRQNETSFPSNGACHISKLNDTLVSRMSPEVEVLVARETHCHSSTEQLWDDERIELAQNDSFLVQVYGRMNFQILLEMKITLPISNGCFLSYDLYMKQTYSFAMKSTIIFTIYNIFCMTEISLIVTLNNQFTSLQYFISACFIIICTDFSNYLYIIH